MYSTLQSKQIVFLLALIRNANVIFLCNFNSEDSFNHLKDWLEEAKQYSRPEATFMILGNKRDLSINGERQVEFLTSSQFAQENDCLLFETSALTGENVENAFYKIVQTILNKIESGDIQDSDYSIRRHVTDVTNSRNRQLKGADMQTAGGSYCAC